MKTSKLFLFAAAFVLLASLSAGAMAQDTMGATGATIWSPPEPIQPTVTVDAIEVTDGIVGLHGQTQQETVFGYSFLGQTTGSLPGSFTLAMNCTPAIPMPGETNEVTGGAWTLPVYMTSKFGGGKGYMGSLYGTIAKGTMNWDKTGTSAIVIFDLNIDGGTQTWDGVGGYATFVGAISVDEKTQKTTLTGELVFTIK